MKMGGGEEREKYTSYTYVRTTNLHMYVEKQISKKSTSSDHSMDRTIQ